MQFHNKCYDFNVAPALNLCLQCTEEVLRCGFNQTRCRNRPERKDYKNMKLWLIVERFVPLLPPDKGDVELPKLPVQALVEIHTVNP